jgi:hypothetical protein
MSLQFLGIIQITVSFIFLIGKIAHLIVGPDL